MRARCGITISGLLCLFFIIYPNIDIFYSKLLYNNYSNNYYNLLKLIFNSVHIAVIANYVGCVVFLFYNKFQLNKKILYIIVAGLIGPGLIVNGCLKQYIGRARPKEIIEFCGTKKFTKPFALANQCTTNCSFPSGHAAFAYYLTVWSAIFDHKRKHVIFLLFILFGTIVGIGRVMQGGHFISDVVAACFIILVVNKVLLNLLKLQNNNFKKLNYQNEQYRS